MITRAIAASLFLFSTLIAQTSRPTSRPVMALHEATVYTVVRVLCGQGGGSGTLVYSKAVDSPDKYVTAVITNHHVIAGAIKVEKKWSSLLNAYADTESKEAVKVEVFRYENISRVVGRESFDADILAYSSHKDGHDLAVLQIRCDRQMPHVAKLRSRAQANTAFLFDAVYAIGCTHLHSPVATAGQITSLNDEIDGREYWMGSSPISYGNSGGAVFRQDTLEFVGIPSAVDVAAFGSPVTHMAYWIPLPRIYKWLEEEHLGFLYGEGTPAGCLKEREMLQRRAQLQRVSKEVQK